MERIITPFFAFSLKMWYYIHLGDVLIRRNGSLKTASRVGNLNPVNYGFKTINDASKLRDDAVATLAGAANKVKGIFAPSVYGSAFAVA